MKYLLNKLIPLIPTLLFSLPATLHAAQAPDAHATYHEQRIYDLHSDHAQIGPHEHSQAASPAALHFQDNLYLCLESIGKDEAAQIVRDITYETAERAHNELHVLLERFRLNHREEAIYSLAPLKGIERVMEKAENDYKGQCTHVTDIVRSSIIAKGSNTLNLAYQFLQSNLTLCIGEDGKPKDKDRFNDPMPNGMRYRLVVYNINLPDLHLTVPAEVQFYLWPYYQVKHIHHPIYEIERAFTFPHPKKETIMALGLNLSREIFGQAERSQEAGQTMSKNELVEVKRKVLAYLRNVESFQIHELQTIISKCKEKLEHKHLQYTFVQAPVAPPSSQVGEAAEGMQVIPAAYANGEVYDYDSPTPSSPFSPLGNIQEIATNIVNVDIGGDFINSNVATIDNVGQGANVNIDMRNVFTKDVIDSNIGNVDEVGQNSNVVVRMQGIRIGGKMQGARIGNVHNTNQQAKISSNIKGLVIKGNCSGNIGNINLN